jgi:hypothetical protein
MRSCIFFFVLPGRQPLPGWAKYVSMLLCAYTPLV